MKEFFCNECRRHKKIELLAIDKGSRKKCTACAERTNAVTNRTKTELCHGIRKVSSIMTIYEIKRLKVLIDKAIAEIE